MKAEQKTQQKVKPLEQKELLLGFTFHALILFASLFISLAPVIESLFPFGVSMVGGVKRKYLSSAVMGAAIGYIIKLAAGGFLYIAAIAAVLTIRIIVGEKSRLTASSAFKGIIVFFTLLVTGLTISYAYDGNALLRVGEAAISGSAAYFISVISKIYFEKVSGLDIRETVSICFIIGLFLLSLYPVNILGLSLGQILGITIILFSSRYGQAPYGAISGTIICFTLAIYDIKYLSLSVVFAFSGLLCGLFSSFGYLGITISYITSTFVCLIVTKQFEFFSIMLFEAIIGCGIFFLIPKKIGFLFSNLFAPSSESAKVDSVKNALIMRLEFASGALKDIYKTVEGVSSELSKINNPDFEKTLHKIEEEVCVGCSLRKHCWETAKEITANDALNTWKKLNSSNNKEYVAEKNCLRENQFRSSVESHVAEYNSRLAAENRLKEVRNIVSDQFEGISDMIFDLSEEFKYEVRHDAAAAENIILAMKNMGYHAVKSIAAKDKFNRLSADIYIKGVADKTINKMELVKNLSLAVGKELDTPSVSTGGDEAFVFITEKPRFKAEIGVSQIPESKGKLCGDSYRYFCDGRGRFLMLISDGMGTGGRAAVDSAMVSGLISRMLRSGFGYDCALKIVNSSMLFKSTDESLCTVDISAIDLFSGECELLKAGAAPTYLKRSGKVGKAQSNSLPPGILRNVSLDRANIKIKKDDILVMVSDGVVFDDDQWLCEIIDEWTIGTAQNLADEIAYSARRRRNDGHHDDITVMVTILKER